MEIDRLLNSKRFVTCGDLQQPSENRNDGMETPRPCSALDFDKQQRRELRFSSKLVKVTEEEKREKPRRARHWKGRKAAERAKRQALGRTEVDAENPRLDFLEHLDNFLTNSEENDSDFLPSLECLPGIEEYLSPVSFVNFSGELPSIELLEAESTGKVFYSNRLGCCCDILRQKIQEAKELNVEEKKLIEGIKRVLGKAKKNPRLTRLQKD